MKHGAVAESAAETAPTLAELTTMRVGGPAERVLVAKTREDLVEMAEELWDEGEPWLLLGGGSNTIVSDAGYPGTVLLVRTSGIERIADPDLAPGTVRLRVQAGQDWDELVATCVAQGLAGIEALSGIPGLAGAAPVQNIGAYGQELSDVLHSIEFLPGDFASDGEVRRMSVAELELGYRDSVIKQGLEGVVLSIDLLLREGDGGSATAPVQYEQLARALGVELGAEVPIGVVRDSVLRLRSSKGMVLNTDDRDSWSAGSFFTNPIVSESFARTLPENAPRFPVSNVEPAAVATTFEELARGVELRVAPPAAEQRVKLSAAWLIENAGVPKGFRLPGSGSAISSKHTLALTNRGGASAADVAELARFVVQRVQQEFGVILVPEPNLYGLQV